MASLQIAKFAGAYASANSTIPDGPPTACRTIAAGAGGSVYGADSQAVICELTPLNGDVTITWPNGVVETITVPCSRALRGEAITVA